MVAIDSPPPKTKPEPIFLTVPADKTIVRIYDPNSFGAKALSFRTFGPIHRFDHQRAIYPDKIDDANRGIIYGAYTLSSCIVEAFGDSKVIEVGSRVVAAITTTRQLKFLDLRGSGAMLAGTVAAIAKESNRRFSQEWSRYFYDTEFVYSTVDGLAYYNAHNDEVAYALYERASNALKCNTRNTRPLRHDSLRATIREIAIKNGLVVEPY